MTSIVSGSDSVEFAIPAGGKIEVISFPTKGYKRAAVMLERLTKGK